MRLSPATLAGCGAIALWSTLGLLSRAAAAIPPLQLTAMAFAVSAVLGLALLALRGELGVLHQRPVVWLHGIFGLFGFHALYFAALAWAPPAEANLINYLWPLLMVVLAPVLLKNMQLRPVHLGAGLLGFGGAALAILGAAGGVAAAPAPGGTGTVAGYLAALAAAFMWASYSLLTQRVAAFPTAAIGLFALVSGALSLLCHWALEAPTSLSLRDGLLLALMGLGPLGGAFFLWDKALKLGDARQIGILSYLTPLGSTALLIVVTDRQWSWSIALAAGMIMAAAVLGTRAR